VVCRTCTCATPSLSLLVNGTWRVCGNHPNITSCFEVEWNATFVISHGGIAACCYHVYYIYYSAVLHSRHFCLVVMMLRSVVNMNKQNVSLSMYSCFQSTSWRYVKVKKGKAAGSFSAGAVVFRLRNPTSSHNPSPFGSIFYTEKACWPRPATSLGWWYARNNAGHVRSCHDNIKTFVDLSGNVKLFSLMISGLTF